MASRTGQIAAIGLALGLAAFILLPAIALFWSGLSTLSPATLSAVRFTLLQAALSAAVSTLLAIPVARALARRDFPGKPALITLLGAPFLLPVIVAVFGLLAIFGRFGPFNQALASLGLPSVSIFGLQGVVLAHVFLNLPLATRMLLQGWQSVPAERFRLAATLGLSPSGLRHHIEFPMLRAVLPGVVVTVFLLCLTSFVVALTLGGGPGATTLELAIYQALRFDFNPSQAAQLSGLQFAICAAAVLLSQRFARPTAFGAGLDRSMPSFAPSGAARWTDAGLLVAVSLFLLLPLVFVVLRGLPGLSTLPDAVWPAAARSVGIALVAAGLSVAAATTMAVFVATASRHARWVELSAMLPLTASGLVLGTGLFILIYPFAAPERWAVLVTIGVNAALSLPFCFRLLLPHVQILIKDYGRLSESLGLTGRDWLRLVAVPRLAGPLGFAIGIAAALSMGDLGVIALFAGDNAATLPLVVQRLMGAYRMDQAAAAALLLVMLSFAIFWFFDAWGRRYAVS